MDMATSRQESPDPSIASTSTKRWRNGIDLETADNDEIEGFIEWRIKVYKREEWRGKDLWEVFEDDFEGFTKETFQGGGKDATRKLRDCLRAKGVYVPKDRKLITANLELVLNEHQEWPADDKEGPIQELITPSPYLPPTLPTFAAPDERERTLRPPPEEGEPSAQPAFARTVPQARDTRRNGYGKELAMLLKMHGEEHKYSGENDNFDYKYQIFLDSCDRAGVPQEALMIAFPTMLKGPALDFFYANKIKGYKRIEQVCESIKNYFEGKEHKRGLLSKWNSLTLKNVIEENQGKGKNTQECLQLLIQELRHLQHGLDKELQNDKFIHNKLIDACQEVPACTYACFKPADNLAGLISDLRSSIITYEKANRSNMSAFFTDRKYRGQDRQRNQYKPRDSGKKRCFVCKKEGCWSSNHTQAERDQLRTRFNKRMDQFIAEYEGDKPEQEPTSDSGQDDSDGMEERMESLIFEAKSPSPEPARTSFSVSSFITEYIR